MESLRHAAERMLQALGDQSGPIAAEAVIERMSIDVRIGDQTEVVVLRLRGGQLQTSCTCGAPGCAHAEQALRLLVEPQSLVLPQQDRSTQRSSPRLERVVIERASGPEARATAAVVSLEPRISLPLDVRPVDPRPASGKIAAPALAEAIEDVVTAVVRAGLEEHSASVPEMLARVAREAGTPLPLGVQRWIGRVRDAIDRRDVPLVAHALAAATFVAEDLRTTAVTQGPARTRLATWLGHAGGFALDRVSDRLFLEVAREWLNGTARQQIERRYLVDLNSGEVFREERARRTQLVSVGGCPRLIGVGFAEVELGCSPRRMHLLQYTTTPSIDRASWDLLATWAQRDSEAIAAAYRSSLAELGALSEPFALVLPREIATSPAPALVLDRGAPLPLGVDDGSGLLKRFLEVCANVPAATEPAKLAWVAGRLFDRDGLLQLKPLAVGILTQTGLRHERL